MKCHHCEGHVKEALEKIDGVVSASPSHERKTVGLELSKDLPEEIFAAAINALGYEFLGIEN